MAGNRTRMYIDRHAYSLFDPEEIHRDLRLDPVQARTVMARNPQVEQAHAGCQQCREIAAEHATTLEPGDAAAGYASLDAAIIAHTERRTKYVISRANLARMLQLGPGEQITRMYLSDDPQMLHVVIAGEHFPPVPDGMDTPVTRMSRPPTGRR